MPTTSVWEDTRTFFPLFLAQVEQRGARSACVVGASDGKFVLPLARRGIQVLAIERNQSAVDGGPVTLPGQVETVMPGLRKRLAEEGLADSWHYSVNHVRPLADFVATMSRLCRPRGGLFGAEYMMPVEPRHFAIEHYPGEGQVRGHLPGWRIDWETYTPAFVEAPHIELLIEHVHRMGLIIATRP